MDVLEGQRQISNVNFSDDIMSSDNDPLNKYVKANTANIIEKKIRNFTAHKKQYEGK